MKMMFSLGLCLLSTVAYAAEYTISLIGTESERATNWVPTALNNKGQVLGSCQNQQDHCFKSSLFLFDPQEGLTILDNFDHVSPVAFNNGTQAIGHGQKPFLWSKALGFHSLFTHEPFNVQVKDLNDLGQIIGTYSEDYCYIQPIPYDGTENYGRERAFLWDNGIFTDMGPGSKLSSQIESCGYHVLNITLTSLNNKGEIAGHFLFGKYHQKQKKYIAVGWHPFFWNGNLHVISLPHELEAPGQVQLNNRGVVLVSYGCSHTSFLWSLDGETQRITQFYGEKLNDSSVVVGNQFTNTTSWGDLAIWQKGNVSSLANLLDVENLLNIAPAFSDNYTIERIYSIIDINNKGQLLCNGWIWGECHPCLLNLKDSILGDSVP